MGSDSSFPRIMPRPFVDESLHPLDQTGCREPRFVIGAASQFTVDDVAHALEHAPDQSFGQCLFPFFRGLVLVFRHMLWTSLNENHPRLSSDSFTHLVTKSQPSP